LAIGHLAVNLGSEMKPFIEEIMKNVKDALRQKGYVPCGWNASSNEAHFKRNTVLVGRKIRRTKSQYFNALLCSQQPLGPV